MNNSKTKCKSLGMIIVIFLSIIPIIYLIEGNKIKTSEENPKSTESESQLFTEEFTTTQYMDSGNTDVFGWGFGEITNSRKDPTLIGSCFISDWTSGIFVLEQYAYIASKKGLLVVDISDLTNPISVGICNPPGRGYTYEVFVSGDFAYIIEHEEVLNQPFDWRFNLHIIDIRPTSPTYLSIIETFIILEADYDYLYGIDISDDLAYITIGLNLYIIDISDPTNPVLIGSLNNLTASGYQVYVSGGYAYVATSISLDIIYISDPVNPIKVSSLETLTLWDIHVSGIYAYATKAGYGLYVFDISDPNNPSKISQCYTGSYSRRIQVSGSHAFICGDKNLQVIDISIPSNPVWIASWGSPPAYLSDVYVLNGYAYITGESLFITRISNVGDYKSQCYAQSKKINKNGYVLSATLLADDIIPSGTNIIYFLSADGGLRWEEVTLGVLHDFTFSEFDLRWKAILLTSDIAPSISSVTISYNLAEPGNQDINIITPDSKVYTEPMSGYFYSTYGFENEEHGTKGLSIDFIDEYHGDVISHCGMKVLDGPEKGHKKILSVGDAQRYHRTWCVHNCREPQTNGTIEFFLWSNQPPPYWGSATKRHYMQFRANDDTVAFSMMVQLHDSKILYNNGSDWKLIATVSPEVWYHHSVSFDCKAGLNGQFTWIIRDEQGNEINRVENIEFENNLATIEEIYISTDRVDNGGQTKWDAFGFSWDPNYEIEDNLKEGLLLYYETNIDLNWTGYSLDDQNNITILGNTVIKMPENGTHRIQVFGNDSYGKFYQSDKRYFAINNWEDITPPVITIYYQDGDGTDGNSGKWIVFAYDDESGINEDTINVLIDGEFAGDTLGDYDVPNTLGEHTIYIEVENDIGYLGSESDSVTIVDDDTSYPEMIYIYTGDGTDGNPGEIIMTASDDSGLSVDPSGTYPVPNSLGTHNFIFTATDNDNDRVDDALTRTITIVIDIIDDDVTAPVIDIQYIGSGFDDDPGYFEWNIFDIDSGINHINITVFYESTEGLDDYTMYLEGTEMGSWDLPSNLGIYTIRIFTRDNDDDRTLFVDSLTIEVTTDQEILDDDADPPELSNLAIIPDIFEINVTIAAIDESGIGDISTFINGDLIEPITQIQYGNTYSFIFENQWLFQSGASEVVVQVEDGDDDRPNDALASSITGTFENVLYPTYEYIIWQLGELKNYIDENLCHRVARSLNGKLSKAQDHLYEAINYFEDGSITCALFHDCLAKLFIRLDELRTEIFNRKELIADDHAEYIIESLHEIRNNIVLLMGASTGEEKAYKIALIEVELLNLKDFIEDEIPCCVGRCLSAKISVSAKLLELALFEISRGYSIDYILEYTQCKLEYTISKINFLLEKGKIPEDVVNYLIEKISSIIGDIEQIKNN